MRKEQRKGQVCGESSVHSNVVPSCSSRLPHPTPTQREFRGFLKINGTLGKPTENEVYTLFLSCVSASSADLLTCHITD